MNDADAGKEWDMNKEELDMTEEEIPVAAETEENEKVPETKKAGEAKKEKKGKKDDGFTISKAEAKEILQKFEEANAQCAEANDKYVRMLAEYDNYRRRTAQEKANVYADAYVDVLKELLPVIDNLERAGQYHDPEKVQEGVEITLHAFRDALQKLGIEVFGEVGELFDPNIHNAVAHTENAELGENVIASVFQKGYRKGDRVLRFAMVQVAN